MRTNEILTTIPSIPHGASPNAPPDTALEIAVETAQQDGQNEQEDGQPSIALRRLTWGSGVGLVSAANPNPDSGGSRGGAPRLAKEPPQMAGRICYPPG